MQRLHLSLLAGLLVLYSSPVFAQTSPNATPQSCKGLSPIAERACYAAQDAAAVKQSLRASTKQSRKDAIAAAIASTDPPQTIGVRLLNSGYGYAALKRYRTQLVSSPGHPIMANGALNA